MSEDQPRRLPEDYFRKPSSARVWNYWLGGKDHYPIDETVGDAVAATYPQIVTVARQSRQFLRRAVRLLAGELEVRQFLDVGTGLPTMLNTHEVAQSVAPDARVLYVDNDPVVLAHAHALLTSTTSEGRTDYLDADVHDPELIISSARTVLDFDQPVAVLFLGILGYVADYQQARGIVDQIMAAVPSGSYLAVRDNTPSSDAVQEAAGDYAQSGVDAYHLRTLEQLHGFFTGLELVEPGLVPVETWRPEQVQVGGRVAEYTGDHAGLARKP